MIFGCCFFSSCSSRIFKTNSWFGKSVTVRRKCQEICLFRERDRCRRNRDVNGNSSGQTTFWYVGFGYATRTQSKGTAIYKIETVTGGRAGSRTL